MRFLSMRKSLANASSGSVAALDIGTSKVCCGIARLDASGNLVMRGFGHQASRGLRNGAIVDMEALAASVAAAVHPAEEMAEETISEVFVSISPAIAHSQAMGVEAAVSGHPIDETDVRKMVAQACQGIEGPGQSIIHAIPMAYDVDGSRGIRDPRGMFGDRLGATIYVLSAATGPLRNLAACVERCHLDVVGFVVSSYASGLSTLVEDEIDLGVTLIEMGAGATSIAVFHDGKLYHTDYVPVGGAHVTADIARGLSTPLHHAERLKTLHGSAMVSPTDEREKIMVPQIGEDDPAKGMQVSRAELVRIIRPRIEETFELVRERLKACDADKIAGKRLVLTGGASQLSGANQLANLILDKQGRLGKPHHLKGLDQKSKIPSFSTCAGLLAYGKFEQTRAMNSQKKNQKEFYNVFGKIGLWVRENL